MYKYLLFDLDNTLLDFDLAEDKALNMLLKEQNVDNIEEFKEKYTSINKQLWHQLDNKEISREFLINNRFRKLFSCFDIEVDGKHLAKRYEYFLSMQGYYLEGAVQLLDKLKDNYEIYAATNGFYNIQTNRLENSSLQKYFKEVFISEVFDVQKPDKRFFEIASSKIPNFEKEKALMIGDNIFADIQGAKNFGIDSVWCNFKNIENNTGILATYEVKNYDELLELLTNSNN
ncbi:noncanonical pyrimidine nucleotidase, YjjG family [Gemella sp. GH3]|uniref:YjjG family noncanonical pyrimidine nucleotidase n=1 Tax=unclassified Gemella TaxID=2624949 RepID=UPI0015D0D023|nr:MULTISPECIES: YjjG family noncanonical pyrimidine nucleotidase [unclassified Gemella]MBF0713580.1 noncanonical pyrimidine nucleotidase, YjjG family [Gemella sp. GH3.1]NYS50532.1 noncanonical pyrimidine nucleotidase, YjjG family [Gemella sp. GH3]